MTEQTKPKHAGSRPCKLTPELQGKFVDLIRMGSYVSMACAACGIDFSTYRNWMAKGEAATRGRFFEFFQAVKLAEAMAEVDLTEAWQNLAKNDWRGIAEFMARRWPSRWGKSSSVEMSGPGGSPITVQYMHQAINGLIEKRVAALAAGVAASVAADDGNGSRAA